MVLIQSDREGRIRGENELGIAFTPVPVLVSSGLHENRKGT